MDWLHLWAVRGIMMPSMNGPSSPLRRVVAGNCGICPSGCAVRVTMNADRIERLTPDSSRPHGTCCPRVGRSVEIVYSPDRLLSPLAREGARGEDRFRKIGWDEALDTIAERLRDTAARFGPEAACLYTGRGTFERSRPSSPRRTGLFCADIVTLTA